MLKKINSAYSIAQTNNLVNYKTKSANFLVVIVARIWVKLDFVLFNFFQDKLGRVTCYRPQGKQKNK